MCGGDSINTKRTKSQRNTENYIQASRGTYFLTQSQRKSVNETLYPRLPEVGPTEKQSEQVGGRIFSLSIINKT